MEQQSTTSNIAAGTWDFPQPETNVPQQQPQQQIPSPENDAQVSLLKPELLRVGFIGLFHNPCMLVIMLLELIFLSIELNEVIKWKNKNPDQDYHYHDENGEIIVKDVTSKLVFSIIMLLIASALAIGAIVMDVVLRGSTYLVNRQQRKDKLQLYLIVNIVFLVFSLVLSAVMYFLFGEFIHLYFQLGLIVSYCLRAVCIFVVFQSWVLLRQWPVVKNFGGYPIPSTRVQQHEFEMEQGSTTSDIAVREAGQPETSLPQQPQQQQTALIDKDVLLSFLKPELLSVGLLSLFNNLSLLVILLCYFIYWSVGFDQYLKMYRKNRLALANHTVNGLENAKGSYIFSLVMGHLFGFLLAVGAIVTDVFLRRSTILGNNLKQRTKLHYYLIMNIIFLMFASLMTIVIFSLVPTTIISHMSRIGLIMSNCLRAACIFVVYKYKTLLGQFPVFMQVGGYLVGVSGSNQYPAQAIAPPAQVQQM